MRDKPSQVLVLVIVVSILALIGTSAGLAALFKVSSAGASTPVVQATPAHGITHVFIHNYAYQPASIQVVLGSTVTWTNEDTAIHSVVLPHIIDSETDIRESGPLSQGRSFRYTFLARGTFPYYCAEHASSMTGTIIVL